MKKILFADFDGTLGVHGIVSETDREALKRFREAGNLTALNTGRGLEDAAAVARYERLEFDYICSCDGTYVSDGEGRYVADLHGRIADYPGLLDLFLSYKPVWLRHFYKEEGVELDPGIPGFVSDDKLPLLPPEEFADGDFIFFLFCGMFADEATAEKVASAVADKYGDEVYVYSYDNIVDMFPAGGGKGYGVKKVLEVTGLVPDAVYSIGDAAPDLSMMEGYHGYFMNSAAEELKAKAEGSVPSVAALIDLII